MVAGQGEGGVCKGEGHTTVDDAEAVDHLMLDVHLDDGVAQLGGQHANAHPIAGAIALKHGVGCAHCASKVFSDHLVSYSLNPTVSHFGETRNTLAMLKISLPFLNEGGHALFLILSCKKSVEGTALKSNTLGQGGLKGGIDGFLTDLGHEL